MSYQEQAHDEMWDEIAAQEPPSAWRCPYCDRVMSNREGSEQGACNDCHGGAYSPSGRTD